MSIPLSSLKNLKHVKAKKLLEKHGWVSINRYGSHETFFKVINGKEKTLQLIWHTGTMRPSNVKVMILKSDIEVSEWIKKCK